MVAWVAFEPRGPGAHVWEPKSEEWATDDLADQSDNLLGSGQ